jgi:hypothetical protein
MTGRTLNAVRGPLFLAGLLSLIGSQHINLKSLAAVEAAVSLLEWHPALITEREFR